MSSIRMRYVKRCLLIVAGLLLGLAILEVLCRCFLLFVPPMRLGEEDKPRALSPYSRRWQPHFAEENRMWAERGIPLRELGYKTPYRLDTGTRGVVVVGDSFTAAAGVKEEEGYVELLRRTWTPMPVVNLGAVGSGLDNMNYQLRSFVDGLKPRLVVCAVYADDLQRHRPDWLLVRNRPVGFLRDGKVAYAPASEVLGNSFLYYHSRTYQIYNYALRKKYDEWASNFLTFGSIYRLNEALLREMHLACERHKSQLVVVYIPSRKQLEKGGIFRSLTRPRSLARICREQGIPFLDLTPDLESEPSEYYLPNEIHFSTEGHRLTSSRLIQFLRENQLFGERPE